MRTNVLNDLSNVVKKGTSRVQVGYKVEEETLAGSWSQRGQISDEGAIEHPLITHSAPFGIRWKPAGEKGSSRVWKYVVMIFAVLTLSIANIGMAWGQTAMYSQGWENNNVNSWAKNNTTSIGISSTEKRTGGYALTSQSKSGTSGGSAKLSSTIQFTKNTYVHAIVWAKAGSSVNSAIKLNGNNSSNVALSTSSWTRLTHKYNYTGSSGKKNVELLMPKNGVADYYFDDLIIYYTTSNSETDLTAPSAATSASATTSAISWTCGTDANTGIQATLIFHRTGGSVGGNDLTLNDQGIYSLTATEGPSVVGNWTLLSASVGAAATSYSGTFEAGHEYAIVHRDLAYNYSTPTYVTVAGGASCEVPSSVTVDGTWRRFPGETITLTATATGGVGTKTYQWQKYMVDTWTNLAGETSATFTKNCTKEDAGQYRCVVSTGATCSLASDGYNVRVYTLEGKYEGGSDVSNNITVTSGTTGTATVNLEAGRIYRFKVVDNVDKGYGNEGRILANVSGWNFWSDNANYAYLFTGPAGAYTFTVNTANADATPTPSVAVNVAYPEVSHPAEGYAYFESAGWGSVGLYMWYEGGGSYTSWDDAPLITNTVEICSKTYYYTPLIPDWYNRVIFRNKSASGQTGDITISDLASYSAKYVTSSNATWQPFSTYTITYTGNGGGGSMSATSGICPDADQAITSNAFTAPAGCASFAHWTANVAVKVDGAMVAAGNPIANGATIQDINSDITLTAVWKLAAPTIADNGDNTFSISGSIGGASYYYTIDGTTPTTSSSPYSSAVDFSAGETNITAKAIAHKDGYVDSDVASQACTYHAAVTCTGDPTALVSGTLYKAQDMKSACFNTVDGDFVYGLSANDKFYITGTTNGDNSSTGTVEIKGQSKTIDAIAFDSIAWLKGEGSTTHRSIKFVTGGAGTLTVYGHTGKNAGNVQVKPSASSAVNVITASSSGQDISGTYDVTAAGTYYILSNGNSAAVYGIKFVAAPSCTTPDAPTAFANTAVTSSSATFSITDAGDAASYDLYYASGSPATPTAETAATENVNTKTPTITGLDAETTYTIWVRSVCDASHKSAWVALSGSTFTTSAVAVQTALECNTLYKVEHMVPASITLSETGQYGAGLSANTKFEVLGDPSKTDQAGGAPEMKNEEATINTIVFPARMYLKRASNLSEGIPTSHAVKFIVGESGTLDIYAHRLDRIYLKKAGGDATQFGTSTSTTPTMVTFNVTAGTYYIYSTGGSTCVYGVRLNCCTTPAAPTAFTAGSITSTGATFSITDAANAASYDIYYSTSSDAPTASTPATTTSTSKTKAVTGLTASTTYYAWARSVCDASHKSAWVALSGSSFTTSAPAATYSVTHSLTNVTATSGATGAGAATEGVAYDAVFAASSGYVLPSTITVTIGGSPATVGTGYTWNASTGAFQVPAAQVTGAIVITIAGETAPATKDIYYGQVAITDGALVREITNGTIQFFTNIGGTVANTTEISLTSTPSTTGMYYNSNNLTDTELSKSSNWGTSSGSNRYVRGLKFANGTTYTLALGSKVASSIKFYGWCGSASKTMTIGGEEYTSSSTKNTFAKHEFIKTGGFTGNVSITENGDFYGILVITIQTATPCTTPDIPALSNQSLCAGIDIAEWDATPTNASTISGKGETVTYSWKRKGNDTELANTATFDLGSSAAESQAGTYVVTVTVSKAGKASSSAYREVELSVTEETEVTNITADKATVYAGNSVTLTATANTSVTWQWYICTSAEGAGEAIISGAASASYTITSAPAAGTHYYKVKVTSDCGNAERVYALVVSAAAGGDCFHFVSVLPASDITVSSNTSLVTPTHATTLEGGTMKVGSSQMTIAKDYGLKLESSKYVTVTLESALEAGNVVIVKGTSASAGNGVTINGVNFYEADSKTFDVSYTVLADDGLVGKTSLNVTKYSGSSYLKEIKITGCGASCTDPEVTASADNTTACVGTSVTFTAANAHALATYQWQKLDGTWTNISGENASTYTITSVVAGDAGKYRVIASHDCNRTSNEVTLSVPSAPNFGSTVPASVSVMQTEALSISTVEASDATGYKWYKSADATFNAGSDTEIGTTKNLIKAYNDEAVASPSYYLFCVATNSCGSTTSSAIAVNVTTYVEEDCATRGNEGEAEFEFDNGGCGQASYSSTPVWSTGGSNSKILTYTAPTGKYFKTAKVTIASSSENKASYNWSTDGGSSYTSVRLNISTTLTEYTIDLSAHGNVDKLQIGRNLGGTGSSSGNLYVSKICFEYTESCTTTSVTVSGTGSESYTIGSGAFTEPNITVKHGGIAFDPQPTLTYSSSNEDIATVDDDGTVTFNDKAGSVKITASYAGDATYCASEGSYTITVSCSDEAPNVVPASGTNMSGCNTSVTLNAKMQNGTSDFANGTYQWFRNGEEISGATSASYTAVQAGVYTVERTGTGGCTNLSSNHVTITSETVEPEVKHLVPFQYYHVDKTYSNFMKMRHLFTVKGSAAYGETGKRFKLEMSRNGAAATDVTTSSAIEVWQSADHTVDTVMIDLNKLASKYAEGDELVYTCKAIDCSSNVSETYKDNITMHVIGSTPTLALICSGSDKAAGTRKTDELTVGGDFLTGYNKADLCKQTGNTSFDANTEWGLYTELKAEYIVTPVNGYAEFNKLNYEPFDILFLTDYPKASKDFNKKTGDGPAATILDDMAELCDYRPLFSFKTHMVQKQPSKWAAKGFTTSPVVPKKTDGRLNLNIVCYAHPMFESIKTGADVYDDVGNTSAPLVYKMLSDVGYENSKGMQGFEIAAAENFVTIGLIHDTAFIAVNTPETGQATWTSNSKDRMLVTAAERQTNIEARMILFSLNAGAQSKLTDKGEQVVLACLNYLLETDPLKVADCSFTFDNGEGNERTPEQQAINCSTCPPAGDGKWSNPANWGPDYRLLPGEFTSVRIKKPVEVDMEHAHVMSVRILEEGQITIPAGKALDVKSTIRRMDGTEIYPTDVTDIHIGSASTGNGTLIFNNNDGDTKARVDMYSNAQAADPNTENSAANSVWQYIGTPHTDVANARSNYYGSWLYQYVGGTWTVIPNGGPLVAFRGYCITNETAPIVYDMAGTLAATTTQDITIPAGYTVIANSWVAPIDINAITDDDMENISDKTIYFFNTGTDAKGEHGTGTAAGTYRATPIHSASYTGDWQIPSMQGFYISTSSAGTFHLDYDRHVRPAGDRTIVSNPMYAPRRAKAAEEEPAVLKIFARGSRYQDKLVVLEREDFTRGYDSGWDGEAWGGSDLSPMVYVTGDGREDAVSAIPEFEGTVIAFKAGEDDAYTLHFEYLNSDEPLYLFDTENNTYTQIMTGESYYFSTDDKAPHSRFILTRRGPQIATGIEPTSDSSLQGRAKKLLIENKMYILLNGALYDATGKAVK